MELCSSQRSQQVLAPLPVHVTLLGNRVLADLVMGRSQWSGCALNATGQVFLCKGERHKDRPRGERPHEAMQPQARAAWGRQELEEVGRTHPYRLQREHGPASTRLLVEL